MFMSLLRIRPPLLTLRSTKVLLLAMVDGQLLGYVQEWALSGPGEYI